MKFILLFQVRLVLKNSMLLFYVEIKFIQIQFLLGKKTICSLQDVIEQSISWATYIHISNKYKIKKNL